MQTNLRSIYEVLRGCFLCFLRILCLMQVFFFFILPFGDIFVQCVSTSFNDMEMFWTCLRNNSHCLRFGIKQEFCEVLHKKYEWINESSQVLKTILTNMNVMTVSIKSLEDSCWWTHITLYSMLIINRNDPILALLFKNLTK